MRKTTRDIGTNKIAVDIRVLQTMLCCGRDTAVKIGTEAGARVKFGKRVLFNVAKVQAYIDNLSECES